ncbi:MAG: restriction endonuclease subunit S [Succinivibrio sp.]|nr:restriction endonuclease subunit S [Succinivibrio sp.]
MIDTSSWKEFRIGDYFTVEYGTFRPKNKLGVGDYNYITTSGFNNGITDKIDVADHQGNCITVASDGALMGSAFYQEEPFSTSNIVSTLTPFETTPLNKYNAQFICTLIFKKRSEFGWLGFKFSVDRVRNLAIKLPATSDGQPDWEYMNSYMKGVMEKTEKKLENLKKAKEVKHLVNVSEWKYFKITGLFDLSLPKGDLQVKKVKDGTIPLITPSNFNNGMFQRISKHSPSTLYNKGSLTVDMFGNAYYQEESFFVTAHGHVNVLLPKTNLNMYTGTFLATAIRTMFLDKYGFNEMCTQTVLKAESIKLPIDAKGAPNWQYMEDYMKNIMNEAENTIKTLTISYSSFAFRF